MINFLAGYVMGERAASRAATFARSAGGAAGSVVSGEIHDVNARVDRLLLVVDAMWSLLRESGWTDEQLAARITELDSSDGVIDGKRTAQAQPCRQCQAMIEPGRTACVFCGAPVDSAPHPLDSV